MKEYSLREAAEIFGVRIRTMREWVKTGKIKAEKWKNRWYWRISESEIVRRMMELDQKRLTRYEKNEDEHIRDSV